MASSASFNPRITILNSSAPTPEPTPESTGQVFWLSERIQNPNEGEDLVLEIDYNLDLFQTIFVDGKELTPNEDYYLEEGSTIITIKGSYVKTLPSGTHNIVIKYSNDREFATTFVISEHPEDVDESMLIPNTGVISAQMSGANSGNNAPFIFSAFFIILIGFILFKKFIQPRIKVRSFSHKSFGSFSSSRPSFRTSRNFGIPRSFKMPRFTPKIPKYHKSGLNIKPRKVIPIVTGLVVVSGILYLCFNVFIPNPNEEYTLAAPTDQNALSISTSDGDFTKDADLRNGSTFFSTSQAVAVNNATSNGYKLFISTDSAEYNDLSINGSASTDARISASSNTFSEPDVLEADTYGFAISSPSFGNNYTPSLSSKWAGVPALGSETTIKETSSATPAGDSTTVFYGFYLTDNLPNGTYFGTNNSKIVYKAIPNVVPDYTITYYCNDDFGNTTSQSKPHGTAVTLNSGTPLCSKAGYNIVSWNTRSDGAGETYSLGSTYNKDQNINLYAVWQATSPSPTPSTYNTFILNYDANGGNNAPAQQSKTTIESSASFPISATKPTRSNYSFIGWCTVSTSNSTCPGTIYQNGNSITISNPKTITLYAVWQYSGPVKVTSISISGNNNILLNASNHTTTLTASVLPANASNKTVTWSSSNNKIATVSASGVVTAVDAGVATITATANDGSGKKATFNVIVKKKVLIILGASQIARINGASYANIKSYTDASSGNVYSTTQNNQYNINNKGPATLNDTLNFIYYSGRGYQFETGENWSKDAAKIQESGKPAYSGWSFTKQIIKNYSSRKDYVEFYVYFTISGNDTKYYSCDEINSNASKTVKLSERTIVLPTIKEQIKKYYNNIAEFGNAGYNIHGYVTSQHPMKADQGSNDKYVKNNNPNYCTAKYRSNFKYDTVNKKYSSYIGSNNKYITYVDTFDQIIDATPKDRTKWTFKKSWGAYNTSDGIHWNNDTAKRYFNFWLNLNSAL